MTEKPGWLTADLCAYIEAVAYEFHVRAFGEQLARINFLPLEERKTEVRAMVEHARAMGVRHEKPALGVTP